ncbi:hypothetical protein SAMN05421863_1004131 [Nitrosomonas communis]|uniref:Uncharacterized protein n=1 Tax=Nitrosomonas communis TaxID=44574 RepID=A0A1I4KMM4_9PROT|nr:hypothetical protein SAMN05421863_1004131 [Nitrosomonas communis]
MPVNFHGRCFFPETAADTKDKYYYEIHDDAFRKAEFISRCNCLSQNGIAFEQLDIVASKMSGNEATAALNKARQALFQSIGNDSSNLLDDAMIKIRMKYF